MRCPECKVEVRVAVNLMIDVPFKYYRKITKKSLRAAGIKVTGADWENATFYCPRCGRPVAEKRYPGKLVNAVMVKRPCTLCKGRGRVDGRICTRCRGKLYVEVPLPK